MIKKIKKKFLNYFFGIIFGVGLISLLFNLQFFRVDNIFALSYFSFSLIHFIGYLFFVFLPIDFLPWVYLFAGYNWIYILIISLVTALLAHVVNYFVGYSVSKKVIKKLIKKEKYEKAKKTIDQYGGYAIFLFNLFPLPSSILMLAGGMVRYDFKKAIGWSALGLFIKYTIIVLVYLFLTNQLF